MKTIKKSKIEWMVKVSMLSAVSVILMLFEFPIPFIAPPFYELDFSEVPVLIGSFALGPMAGVLIELIKIVLNLLFNGTVTAGIGEAANFVVGVAFILPAAFMYRRKKSKKTAVIGMLAGGAIMVVMASVINAFVLIPAYGKAFGIPTDEFIKMGAIIYSSIDSMFELVIFCTLPFNVIKVILVSTITAAIYKPLSPVLKVKSRT